MQTGNPTLNKLKCWPFEYPFYVIFVDICMYSQKSIKTY